MKRLAILLFACAIASGCTAPKGPPTQTGPAAAPAFTLTDQDGRAYIVASNNEPATALYFGFTHCGDTCPATLAMLGRARTKAGLHPDTLRIAMVTVDPAHDTQAALKAYMARIGVQASGLTGTATQLHHVYKAYGVVIEPQMKTLGHTDYVYLIDDKGKLRNVIPPEARTNEVANDLRSLVHEAR